MSETGGLFPFDDTDEFITDDTLNDEEYVLRDFEIDFRTMKMTGRIVEGLDAIEMWVQLALRTKRYEWLIFSWDYGEEYTELIGYSYTKEYLDSEVERCITECVTQHPYITGIQDLTVTVEKDKLHIEFTLITDFGEVEIDV